MEFEPLALAHMAVTTEGSAAERFTRRHEKRQSPACAKNEAEAQESAAQFTTSALFTFKQGFVCPTGKNHCDHKSAPFELLCEKVLLQAVEVCHRVRAADVL